MEPIVEPMDVEVEHAQEKEVPQPRPASSKPKTNKKSHARIKRS